MAEQGQRLRGLLAAWAALTLLATPAFAQPDPSASAQASAAAPSSPDFMLGRPRAMIGVRGNWLMASAGSDIYDFVTDQFLIPDRDRYEFLCASPVADRDGNVFDAHDRRIEKSAALLRAH